MKFSVVMSVYIKENPAFLHKCLQSIVSQTVLPDELIIVKDGPLSSELELVLSELRAPLDVQIITLPQNITQGPARGKGLKAARNEWVAIMDSDDICMEDRFEKQLEMISRDPALSLIGGQIAEFRDDLGQTEAVREVPLNHEAITEFSKGRNPFNSMTVMLKRPVALEAGNYDYFPMFEDYDLWVRMIALGARCANHPDVLVSARTGSGMYGRRRGISYARAELRMQKQLLHLGLIGKCRFVKNLIVRVPVRLLPGKALEVVYNKFARSKAAT